MWLHRARTLARDIIVADFITSISSHSRLNLMALTETWIKPEDIATPAALSNNFSFSHTPHLTGRGGGTGLLISNDWKCILLPFLGINSSYESHSVTITYPFKIHVIVVYWLPGPQDNFLDELDVRLSTFPEDGTPLVMLGDFNIHIDKPQAADFHTLLASFDLKRVSTTATHKPGNQLDLIYTRHCSTDHVLATPLPEVGRVPKNCTQVKVKVLLEIFTQVKVRVIE